MPSFSNTKVSSPAFLPFWSQSLDTPMNINKQNKMNDKQMKHILKFWQCLFFYPFWSTLHSESPVLSPRKHIVRLLHGQRWFHKKWSSGIQTLWPRRLPWYFCSEFNHFCICHNYNKPSQSGFTLGSRWKATNWKKKKNSLELDNKKGNQMPALREGGKQKILKLTWKADTIGQKAESIRGHLLQGQNCFSTWASTPEHLLLYHT